MGKGGGWGCIYHNWVTHEQIRNSNRVGVTCQTMSRHAMTQLIDGAITTLMGRGFQLRITLAAKDCWQVDARVNGCPRSFQRKKIKKRKQFGNIQCGKVKTTPLIQTNGCRCHHLGTHPRVCATNA